MNHIDREKRGDSNYKKIMQALLDERDALRTELETTRKPRCSEDGIFNRGTSSNDSNADTTIGGDTMMDDSGIEGDTILASDSPDMRGINRCQSPIPECLSLNDAQLGGDGAHAHTHNQRQDSEAITLSLDLEAARKEKNDLFNACRAHLPSLEHTAIGDSLRCSSPPPDFLSQILPTLTTALTRASDATESLESVRQELSNLGFAGHNVEDVLFALRSQFRSARLELERLIPGETANAGLEDGNATLGALVKRVEILLKRLDEERKRHDGSVGRETALRGQFNTLLVRYEVSRKKIRNLEEMVSSSGRNLLHTRRQMHDLEQENREQAVGIDRLNTALTKYHEEVKSLEAVVTRLEDENVTCNENHQQQISELEETIEENRIRVCDLTAQVESLERQRQKAIESAEQRSSEQLNRHENEIGSMNVRVSELSTSLDATRSEAEKLRQTNAGLEEQLQLEIGARDDLLDNWAADQARSFAYMKETVQTNRRRAKARAANWELRSDDIQSDNTNIGSEPITPVSMTRFVDVEVGRGKSRRRVDSGIGILSEDMFDDDVQVDLPSDPANL